MRTYVDTAAYHLPAALIHESPDGKIARETIYYASLSAYKELMGS